MHIGEELAQSIQPYEVFSFNLFGLRIPVTDTVINMWIVMAILIIISVILTRKMELIPGNKQNLAELFVEFISDFTKDIIGHNAKYFVPYLGTVFLFLAFANALSLLNVVPNFGIRPPTRDINVTFSVALMSVIVVAYAGIRFKKFSGWLRSYIEPMPLVLPMKIIENVIRMLSLSFRLFGNVLGAFIIMEIIYILMPIALPAGLSIYFDLFDGILQAFIFIFLTTIYISEAVE